MPQPPVLQTVLMASITQEQIFANFVIQIVKPVQIFLYVPAVEYKEENKLTFMKTTNATLPVPMITMEIQTQPAIFACPAISLAMDAQEPQSTAYIAKTPPILESSARMNAQMTVELAITAAQKLDYAQCAQ